MRLFIAALIAGVLVGVSAAPAMAASSPCFGAPADYVAAFDTARGQAADGSVTYSEPRWYDEQQSWATPPFGMMPGHHSDHIHMGRCLPNGETWTTTNRPIDVEYTFHNAAAYTISSVGMSYLWGDPNAGPTANGWKATTAQIAALQAAADASGNAVTHVFQSYQMATPPVNGFKEIRSSLALSKKTSSAVFLTWALDTRWYETDNIAGLATAAGINGQIAVRNRSHVTFPKPGAPTTISDDYHHSGWCGMTGVPFGATQTAGSALFMRSVVSAAWSGDKAVCLYVTDGGGPATLMIDPDFHNHYTGPTAACPNVDANGNCLGVWYWQPANARHEIFSAAGAPQNITVTIPGSVVATLAPGPHRLVFKSDDFPDCFRNSGAAQDWHLCPVDVRGVWTNVSVLPFVVG